MSHYSLVFALSLLMIWTTFCAAALVGFGAAGGWAGACFGCAGAWA
jgi:hypothetical protein